jgi:hypothetical protein
LRIARAAAVLLALTLLPGASVRGAEITALVGRGGGPELQTVAKDPSGWSTCYGGMLTITFFNLVHGEIEGIYQSNDYASTNLLTLSGKAYLGPQIGRLVPYGGLGVGAFNEGLPTNDERGTSHLVFVGAKLKFPMGLVLRGEYQWVSLPETTLVKLDHRYFFGLGLSL